MKISTCKPWPTIEIAESRLRTLEIGHSLDEEIDELKATIARLKEERAEARERVRGLEDQIVELVGYGPYYYITQELANG